MSIRVVDTQHADNLYAFSHPFLSCPETIQHLRRTKTMFLMRGLPGSGKSTLVKILKKIYSESLAVCSADDFFTDKNGVYNFDRSQLQEAHRQCQKNAEDALKKNILTVIIDNTNIRIDECRVYFQKAAQFGYLLLIVEPRTSWKKDPEVLAEKNSHGVPKEAIEARLKQYFPIVPSYFATFLNEEDSQNILMIAEDFYREALKNLPKLKSDLEKVAKGKKIPVEFLLTRKNIKSPSAFLHCTMKFLGRVNEKVLKEYQEYAGNRIVSHSNGKLFQAHLVGFSITPRTLAARLRFDDRNVESLWAQDDNETFSVAKGSQTKTRVEPKRQRKGAGRTTNDDSEDEPTESERSGKDASSDSLLVLSNEIEKLSIEPEEVSFFHPTFGFLSRAHLTCGVAPEIGSGQTGIDLVHMIRQETEFLRRNIHLEMFEDDKCAMKYFSDGQCMIYLKKSIPINSIFAGMFF